MPKNHKTVSRAFLRSIPLRVVEAQPQRTVERVCSDTQMTCTNCFWGQNPPPQVYFCGMYSKQEAAQLRQEFWTAFGQYMSPVISAEGEKVNWVNYKTGEKNIFFRMTADNRVAMIAIELNHKDHEIQQLYYEQFRELKKFLDTATGEEWNWQLHTTDDWGRTVSRISVSLKGVSIFRKEDWPGLISFFKQRMKALDEFWSQVKYSFENLR